MSLYPHKFRKTMS